MYLKNSPFLIILGTRTLLYVNITKIPFFQTRKWQKLCPPSAFVQKLTRAKPALHALGAGIRSSRSAPSRLGNGTTTGGVRFLAPGQDTVP
jgi:hypothetical protein